jgi:hypothetical protein
MRWYVFLLILMQIVMLTESIDVSVVQTAYPEPVIALDRISLPARILTGQEFSVNISIVYSCKQRTMSNIGIYDFGSERIIHPITFYLEGNGSRYFFLRIKAPTEERELKYEALLRYWHLGRWVYEHEALHRSFSVKVTDKIRLGVVMPAPNLTAKIDDKEIRTDSLATARIDLGAGRHLIEAPLTLPLTNNTRLSFLKWSDGSRSNRLAIETQTDTTLTAEYETEYYLTVRSSLGESCGEGWYPSGYMATFSVPSSIQGPIAQGIIPERYVFKSWSRDSDSTASTAQIRMSGPKTVEATWQTDRTAGNLTLLSIIVMIFDTAILASIGLRRRSSHV